MKINTGLTANIEFSRSGGCVLQSRLDIWKATEADWELVSVVEFLKVATTIETHSLNLIAGDYTVVAKFFVEESINGVFSFALRVNGNDVVLKDGDVNTTSNPHDSTVFKNQFMLTAA